MKSLWPPSGHILLHKPPCQCPRRDSCSCLHEDCHHCMEREAERSRKDADQRPDQVQRSGGQSVGKRFPAACVGRETNSVKEGAHVQSHDLVAGHSLTGAGGEAGMVGHRRLSGQGSCSVGHDQYMTLCICQDPQNYNTSSEP